MESYSDILLYVNNANDSPRYGDNINRVVNTIGDIFPKSALDTFCKIFQDWSQFFFLFMMKYFIENKFVDRELEKRGVVRATSACGLLYSVYHIFEFISSWTEKKIEINPEIFFKKYLMHFLEKYRLSYWRLLTLSPYLGESLALFTLFNFFCYKINN
jgi:hypothetical protein